MKSQERLPSEPEEPDDRAYCEYIPRIQGERTTYEPEFGQFEHDTFIDEIDLMEEQGK